MTAHFLTAGEILILPTFAVQLWRGRIRSLSDGALALRETIDSYLNQPETCPTEPDGGMLSAAHEEYRSLLNDAKASLGMLIER
jgi:hypothetical protein